MLKVFESVLRLDAASCALPAGTLTVTAPGPLGVRSKVKVVPLPAGLLSTPPTPPMTISPAATEGVKPVIDSLKVMVMVIGEILVGLLVTELMSTLGNAVSTIQV